MNHSYKNIAIHRGTTASKSWPLESQGKEFFHVEGEKRVLDFGGAEGEVAAFGPSSWCFDAIV